MIKLAIFDLDGTLLNTIDDLAAAANAALAQHSFPTHTSEAYKHFVGDGVLKLIERMTPDSSRDAATLAALKETFDAYYRVHSEDLTAPYEGIAALLETLKAQGVSVAVLSNKPHEFAAVMCEKYFGGFLAAAHGQRQGYPCKPARELVDELLEMSGIGAGECIYIGDSGVDMQTAKNAGVFAIGVLWGFRTREELTENGADALVSHPKEILQYISGNTIDKAFRIV